MKTEYCTLFAIQLVLVTLTSTMLIRGQDDSTTQFTCVTWENLLFKELFYVAPDEVDKAEVKSEQAGESEKEEEAGVENESKVPAETKVEGESKVANESEVEEEDEVLTTETKVEEENKFLPLKIGKRVRSEPYTLKGTEVFKLYIQVEVEGEMTYQVVGKSPIQSKRMLFMIEKNQEAIGLPLKIFGMDDSRESFPVGEFRFLNFTEEPVSVDFSGSVKKIQPGQFATVPAHAAKLGGFQPFFVKNMDGKTIAETRLFARPRERKISIFLPPSKPGGRLKLRFLTEITPLVTESASIPKDKVE